MNQLRLCVYAILNLVPEGLALMAPSCASWGMPNRGTSMRSLINPHGNFHIPSVAMANVMVGRILASTRAYKFLTRLVNCTDQHLSLQANGTCTGQYYWSYSSSPRIPCTSSSSQPGACSTCTDDGNGWPTEFPTMLSCNRIPQSPATEVY